MRKNYQKPKSRIVVIKDNLLYTIGNQSVEEGSGGFAKPGTFGTTGTDTGTQLTIHDVWED